MEIQSLVADIQNFNFNVGEYIWIFKKWAYCIET